ncbi:MAG: mycofactocin biosynthesis peptidyl-dipeptidase MftE [Acidimicrobiales bacterium]
MRWADATSPERAGTAGAVLLVPLGATEQHGPHLPLDTDTRIAVAVADLLAQRRRDTTVAPALPYGASGEHQAFAGTLSIGTDALTTVLVELVRSATGDRTPGRTPTDGDQPALVRLVVLVNGHGGNGDAVGAALDVLVGEGRPVSAWWPRWPDTDSHAGAIETSLLLAIAPETVHLDRAEPGTTTPLAVLAAALRRGGVAAVSPNGVLGDPRGASAARGAALLEDFAADLDTTITATLAGLANPAPPEAGP